ncbi:hypothetical protein COB52_00575 [Candidatus Kaiserbacteria bacterium]|nr:MAG: hypothetical protein COB52_00575 [Candidatus Kaiserbacteria bacterium]
MVNVADALENDKNFELEFFTGANIHLEINFHKHLIAKGLQAVAGVLQKSEMVEPFLPLLEVGSELLEHLKIKFDFKSINDIPEAL